MEQEAIAERLVVLETLVREGFTGVNKRLDTLNGRVYTGEKAHSDLRERVLVLETVSKQPVVVQTPEPKSQTGKATVAGGIGAGAIVAAWELLQRYLP